MQTRCTITIPIEEEQALLEAVKSLSKGGAHITVKKVGRAQIVSDLMNVEQAYYDILLDNVHDDPWLSTTLFQLGQCTAYAQLNIEMESRAKDR